VTVYRLLFQARWRRRALPCGRRSALFESALGGGSGVAAITRADLMQLLD